MDLCVHLSGHHADVVLAGNVDLARAVGLRNTVLTLLAGGTTSLRVDVRSVTFVDAAASRAIAAIRSLASDAGCSWVVTGAGRVMTCVDGEERVGQVEGSTGSGHPW